MGASLSVLAAGLAELVADYVGPALREAKINAGTFELLSALRAAGPNATQTSLARRLGITAPSLSEAVKAAVRKGLVKQVASGTDARSKHVQMTRKGEEALEAVLSAVRAAERTMVRGISATDLRQAQAILRVAVDNLRSELEAR